VAKNAGHQDQRKPGHMGGKPTLWSITGCDG